jgi:hypothetical protein
VTRVGVLLARLAKGFAMFWWDFLVGDTPEIFVAASGIIVVIALVSTAGHFNALAVGLLPVLVVAALALSVWRAARSRRG